MSENIDPKAKQDFMTMIGHSLEVLEDGLISNVNRQSIRNGILETISELMDQRDAANARAEAAESTLDEVYVLTTRELAEPCGKETDTLVKIASTIEAIRLGARDALKGGE